MLQLLQWAGSVFRLTSQPLAAAPSQLPYPAVQAPSAHTPLLQEAAAFAKLHTVEQLLQWLGSDVRLISQPSPIVALQFPKPVLHVVNVQLPDVHVAVELAFAGAQA